MLYILQDKQPNIHESANVIYTTGDNMLLILITVSIVLSFVKILNDNKIYITPSLNKLSKNNKTHISETK